MTFFEKLSTLAEITDQDEMIKACKIIPDEELRLALVVLALAITKTSKLTSEISIGKRRKSILLRKKSRKLEKASK